MTKTSILCYQKNGGSCRNRVSLANNYICGAGHGGSTKTAISQKLLSVFTAVNLSRMTRSQRIDLTIDPSTLPDTLAKLAEDKDQGVRAAVAGNPSASPDTLAKLAEDTDWGVRRAVAWNNSALPEILAKLMGDGDKYVRAAVAGNPSALPEILAKLMGDGDKYVRAAVAGNPSASLDTHTSLARQGYPPYGFTKGKSIDELIKDINLVNQYPDTFSVAYLDRLACYLTSEDETHPKRRALIGYAYAKLAESKTDGQDKLYYKNRIKALFPNDQEMAEMIGC